jgi:hypothetical protein
MKKIVVDFFESGIGGGMIVFLLFIGFAIWSR